MDIILNVICCFEESYINNVFQNARSSLEFIFHGGNGRIELS